MKTTVASLLILASSMFAQGPGGPGGPGGTPPDPATMVQHRIQFLTNELTLTTAQQAQATTIFTNATTAVTPIQTNVRTAHTALAAAVKGNDVAAIEQLSLQLGTYTGQTIQIQTKAEAAFYQILTADQQAKYATVHGGGFGGGFGRPGSRMRPPQ